MLPQNCDQHVNLVESFTLLQKILMRVGFCGFMIVGAYGIYLESMLWGLIYSGFVIFGIEFGLSYFLCSHCPYPYKHSDCLFVPFWVITKQYKFRPAPMSILDKTAFILAMSGFIVIPQYWLLKDYTILILFWIFCLPTIASLPFFWCKRCKNFHCCFNSVSEELISQSEQR
jgi:hypothetical protein